MSQSQLEDLTGIPKSRLSRYENDHLLPSVGGLKRLASALGVPETTLLAGKNTPQEAFFRELERQGIHFDSVQDAENAARLLAAQINAPRQRTKLG